MFEYLSACLTLLEVAYNYGNCPFIVFLLQATGAVLQNTESVTQMVTDWLQLDLSCVVYQSMSCSSALGSEASDSVSNHCIRLHLDSECVATARPLPFQV